MTLKRIVSVLTMLVLVFGCVAAAGNVFTAEPAGCVNFEEAEFRYDLTGYLTAIGLEADVQVEVEDCSVLEWGTGIDGTTLVVLPKIPGKGTVSMVAYAEDVQVPFSLNLSYLTMKEWALDRLWKYPLILLGALVLFGVLLFFRRFRSAVVVRIKIGASEDSQSSFTKFGLIFLNRLLNKSKLNSTAAVRLGGVFYSRGKHRGICWVLSKPVTVLESDRVEVSKSGRTVFLKPGGWVTVQGLSSDATLTVGYNKY